MSTTVDPEGTPGFVQADTPPDTPVEPQWIPLKEAAPLAGVSIKTMRRRVTAGKIAAEMQSGRWMVRRNALPDSAPAPEQAPPAQPSVPEGAMLIPLSAWEAVMKQLGNLHESGQQLADARAEAARYQERYTFEVERRKNEAERREAAERRLAELEAIAIPTQTMTEMGEELKILRGQKDEEPEPEPLPHISDETVTETRNELEELRRHQQAEPWWPDIDDERVEEIGREVEELRPPERRPWWVRIINRSGRQR